MLADVDLACLDCREGPPPGLPRQDAHLRQAALQVGRAGAQQQNLRSIAPYGLPCDSLWGIPRLLPGIPPSSQLLHVWQPLTPYKWMCVSEHM